MKQWLAVLAGLVLVVGLIGCGGDRDPVSSAATEDILSPAAKLTISARAISGTCEECLSGYWSPISKLYGKWATDIEPLGHIGYSHSTFNADGSYELDMEFIVAGSDCFLDVTTTGFFVVDAATVAITHESGIQAVNQCTGENEVANHAERAMIQEELDAFNATLQFMWSIDGGVLTLTDGADIIRTYTRL